MLRFALTGGAVAVVYLTVTTVLSQVLHAPFQLALATGYACGLLLHFTGQRLFVWVHENRFALAVRTQLRRYLAMAAIQYGLTAASTLTLPRALGVATEIVYLCTVVVVTASSFMVMRFLIFHAHTDAAQSP
jgi:putative flippase GtrA